MKLLYTPNSPYARRARLALRETGLLSRTQEVDLHPREQNLQSLIADAPAAKVPVLVTDDGESLCESLIIAHYLDRTCGGKLYPRDDDAFARCLGVEGLASALMDSLFVRSRELRRDEAERSQAVIELEAARATRLYDALEGVVDGFGERLHMDVLTAASSLGYADGRHPDDSWREHRPRLGAWYSAFSKRPAMAQTRPHF